MAPSAEPPDDPDARPGRTEDLLAKARVGDQLAWYSLYQRYCRRLIIEIQERIPTFAQRRFDEYDVLQAAFMKAHRKLDTFESQGEGSFRKWLRAIVFNEFNNEIKANDRERAHRQTESQGGDLGSLADRDEDGRPDAAPRRAELLESLKKLSEEDREIIIMVHLEKLTWARIAEICDCSRDTARTLYERALERLQRLIA